MIWYDIPEFPGYKISREGQVMSLKFSEPRVMKQFISSTGYWSVFLRQNGVYKNCKIHILLMRTFRGPCPPGHQVAHNDGNKLNINLSNLRYDIQPNFGARGEATRTHCVAGHEWTEKNTMWRWSKNKKKKYRLCKRCHAIYTARYRARKQAGLVGAAPEEVRQSQSSG